MSENTAADLYRLSAEAAAHGNPSEARRLFALADARAAMTTAAAAKRPKRRKTGGRKLLPPDQQTEIRSIRMTQARWDKLKALGNLWLFHQIDRAHAPKPAEPAPAEQEPQEARA